MHLNDYPKVRVEIDAVKRGVIHACQQLSVQIENEINRQLNEIDFEKIIEDTVRDQLRSQLVRTIELRLSQVVSNVVSDILYSPEVKDELVMIARAKVVTLMGELNNHAHKTLEQLDRDS